MSKILIIGNVLKDVYLKLDDRSNNLETDAHGIDWLNLGFDGSAHKFFHRTSVYGGAAVTLSVLGRLGLDAKILGSDTEFKNGEVVWRDEPADYRYILSSKGAITYFVPSNRRDTVWSIPTDNPDWILVDRSATISSSLLEELKNFLKFSPTTKLAVHAEKHQTPAGAQLASLADLLFVEDEAPVHTPHEIVDKIDHTPSREQLVCHLSSRHISFEDATETWQLSRTDMLTHLTVYSTVVATVLGVISVGGSTRDAVLWARLNAEQSTLESSLSAHKLGELAAKELEKRANLRLIARSLMTPSKGILAADASDHTLTERFVNLGIPASSHSRSTYHELLFTTPELPTYTSGVILTDATAHEKLSSGQTILDFLIGRGIIVGLKADEGQTATTSGETTTVGLDTLPSRLRAYYKSGVRFTKWHTKFLIGPDLPSFINVEANCDLAASYAKESQLAGLVPVIEIDISRSGDFPINQAITVTSRVFSTLFTKLSEHHVELSACLIKTNMVSSGPSSTEPSSTADIALATSAILKHSFPHSLGGVLFLSGEQNPNLATKNLAAICKSGPYPFPVSFAFSRALETPVMRTWQGDPKNFKPAQATLRRHLEENSAALG